MNPKLRLKGGQIEIVRYNTNLVVKIAVGSEPPVELTVQSDALMAFLKEAKTVTEEFQREMELVGGLLRPNTVGMIAFRGHPEE